MDEKRIPLDDKLKVGRLWALTKEAAELGSDTAKYIWGDWDVAYLCEGPESLDRLLKEAEEDLKKYKK